MKKLSILFFMCMLIFAGCARKESDMIGVENLKREDGSYGIDKIEWGASYEEVSEKLKVSFEDAPILSNDEISIYTSKKAIKILDADAEIEAEYHDDGLSALTFHFTTDDGERLFENISEKLVKEYGEVERIKNNVGGTEILSELWINEGEQKTVLQLGKLGDSVTLALGLN